MRLDLCNPGCRFVTSFHMVLHMPNSHTNYICTGLPIGISYHIPTCVMYRKIGYIGVGGGKKKDMYACRQKSSGGHDLIPTDLHTILEFAAWGKHKASLVVTYKTTMHARDNLHHLGPFLTNI